MSLYDLHALPDDFHLNALGDTDRSPGFLAPFDYYLTDPAGNRLTDPAGNYLVSRDYETVYPQILMALPDDFHLNAPEFIMELTSFQDDFQLNAE